MNTLSCEELFKMTWWMFDCQEEGFLCVIIIQRNDMNTHKRRCWGGALLFFQSIFHLMSVLRVSLKLAIKVLSQITIDNRFILIFPQCITTTALVKTVVSDAPLTGIMVALAINFVFRILLAVRALLASQVQIVNNKVWKSSYWKSWQDRSNQYTI